MRVLIVGSGFVGRALAAHLIAEGHGAVVASRHPVSPVVGDDPLPWLQLDVSDPAACAVAVRQAHAESVVLVHGPSDVTWCEAHPTRARDIHVAGARNMSVAAAGRRLVMISTDNVFDGTSHRYDEDSPTRPANAYGQAKLAAERVVREQPSATILRVSLVYGQESPGAKWLNFFAACTDRLRRGEPVAAPVDQWVTPVLVDDVARVTAAVASAPAPELLHLGGPERISRAEWATSIARRLGVPDDLVTPVPRADSRYASRPENSCLTSHLLPHHPATAHLTIRGVDAGTTHLLGTAPIVEGLPA
ncbi:SDR family oxidoreductase [Micromonospora sp. WMMD736]|uniref:SDR family oxidoreductase n=1 Tax=Micromonospora sp. WMMD736 TaxID=3404112 RepID=UPI003B930E04